jgi:hypothetical protein
MDNDGREESNGFPSFVTRRILGPFVSNFFFHAKKISLSAHFDSIWWLGYKRAIADYPKAFRSFITKQVSGWCGCNSKLSLWEENIINKCPQCGANTRIQNI